MIRWLSNYFKEVRPVIIDGSLYVLIALFGALTAAFSTDEAAKYVEPQHLWYLRTFCGVNSAWILALKMFRSTSFAEHQQAVKTGNTQTWVKTPPQTPP